MLKPIDIKYVNPFLMSSTNIFQTIGQLNIKVGKPELSHLEFNEDTFIIELGIIGAMKGLVMFAMSVDRAKEIAGMMMMSGPVPELDDLAFSALGELGNIILGNTATIFYNQEITIDITPPLTMFGNKVKLMTDVTPLKVPLLLDNVTYIDMYICVTDE